MRKPLILFIFLCTTILGYSQDSRTPEAKSTNREVRFTSEQFAAMRRAVANHPYTKYYDRLVVEYEQRMVDNVKKQKVLARKMQKPQYSNPLYFGHKRKPKKRAVGKRKYCKECDIVH